VIDHIGHGHVDTRGLWLHFLQHLLGDPDRAFENMPLVRWCYRQRFVTRKQGVTNRKSDE